MKINLLLLHRFICSALALLFVMYAIWLAPQPQLLSQNWLEKSITSLIVFSSLLFIFSVITNLCSYLIIRFYECFSQKNKA